MQKLYVFSGLGADFRVFSKMDFSGFEVIHVEWISPNPQEKLCDYVLRLADYYCVPKVGAFVIGVSFGGMCIMELSKYFMFSKIMLISSAKSKLEIPGFYRLLRGIPLYKFIPESFLNKHTTIHNWVFGVKSMEDKKVLQAIIKDTNPIFLKWAIYQVIHWENEILPANYLHIHGNKDHLLPSRNIKNALLLEGGGHLMILNKAKEITKLMRSYFIS